MDSRRCGNDVIGAETATNGGTTHTQRIANHSEGIATNRLRKASRGNGKTKTVFECRRIARATPHDETNSTATRRNGKAQKSHRMGKIGKGKANVTNTTQSTM